MTAEVTREVVLVDEQDGTTLVVRRLRSDAQDGRVWAVAPVDADLPLHVTEADLSRFAQLILDELVDTRCPAVYVDGDGRASYCTLAAHHESYHRASIGEWSNTVDPWTADPSEVPDEADPS